MKTYSAKADDIHHDWLVVDAEDKTLGRLATEIAHRLRGKHKPQFTPHVDTGDFVIVVNAEQVNLTGTKLDDKKYHRYSGWAGGLHSIDARTGRETDPERVIQQAVKGMLPKNRLARQLIKKLKVYGGAEHPHAAQSPKPLPNVF